MLLIFTFLRSKLFLWKTRQCAKQNIVCFPFLVELLSEMKYGCGSHNILKAILSTKMSVTPYSLSNHRNLVADFDASRKIQDGILDGRHAKEKTRDIFIIVIKVTKTKRWQEQYLIFISYKQTCQESVLWNNVDKGQGHSQGQIRFLSFFVVI